ncbi:hypothetical protein AAG906_002058 [Vitis piasezkii]
MCLWRKCWQIFGIYGQPKRHRSQPGSSQGSHGSISPQEQKGLVLLINCDHSSWQYEKLEHTDGRIVVKTLSKRLNIVLCNHPS